MQTTPASRLVPRFLLLLAVVAFFSHVTLSYQLQLARGPLRGRPVGRFLETFAVLDRLAMRYPEVALSAAASALFLLFILYRGWVVLRNKRFTAKATGMADELEGRRFPTHTFLALEYMVNRGGRTFVGLTPRRRVLPPWGLSWRPVYLSQEERSMHRHVLGKTGSGKTSGILWPEVLQDALDGKGVLVIDAKGSDENAKTMRSIAHISGRPKDLRLFALPAWNRPQLFSHAYNLVHVKPRTPGDAGGDVMAMAERVFSVFNLGDNAYFNTQAYLAFGRICRVLHGFESSNGFGLPFNLRDVSVCLRGLSSLDSEWGATFQQCLALSTDREAVEELRAQVLSLGRDVGQCLSGLLGAVDKFQSPLVNAYEPEIFFEDVLERNRLVYVQLPSNLFKLQAPALGKCMLMDLQQEASLRQVFRERRNQRPFSVCVDEFGTFADISIIDSLNKLRDAHIQFTLSHQSMADLEIVSKEFAQAVWDNTRTKDILAQDNPELCERMAKSLGTMPRLENTLQQERSFLSAILPTGLLSTRAVEAYRLHPNRLKSLASRGQGYLFASRPKGMTALPIAYGSLGQLPVPSAHSLRRIDQATAPGLRLYERFVSC
ncbi:MAG: type IV secretory system conjugative DNA transfer family protein [Myxococcaceae bacterium]